MTLSSKLRVGLIVDSDLVSTYVHDLATWGRAHPTVDIDTLIVQDLPAGYGSLGETWRTGGPVEVARRMGFAALRRAEVALLRRHPQEAAHADLRSLAGVVPNIVHVGPQVSRSGLVHRFAPEAVDAVRRAELDVLIRCGSGILRGEILRAARFGILSFHHGDNHVHRGGPAGFWEVVHGEPRTGFILQRLGEELDGGDVLRRGWFPTRPSFQLNQAALYRRSLVYLEDVLEELSERYELPAAEPRLPYAHALDRRPGVRAQARYVGRTLGRVAARVAGRSALGRRYRWSVSVAPGDWRSLVQWKARPIPNLPGRFLADPFVITEGGTSTCFLEEYDYRRQRGHLVAYRLGAGGAERIGPVLAEPFHLSFPFLFRHDGALYLCPECSEAREIRFYRCVSFPDQWELAHTISALPGIGRAEVVDTLVFPHEGRWWLLTTADRSGGGAHDSELFAFYGDSPFTADWHPHAHNPIVVDAGRGRNGGLLREGDALYRVAQRQGFGVYGEGFGVYRIEVLTPGTFAETPVFTGTATFAEGLAGTHHLHSDGQFTAFDWVRRERVSP